MPAKKSTVGAIDKEKLRQIGFALAGSYWQVDVANMADISKSQLTRLLNGQRTSDYSLSQKLKGGMIQKIEQLTPLFSIDPLPDHASAKTKKAQEYLAKATALLKDSDVIMPVWKPEAPEPRGGGGAYAKTRKKAKKVSK